MFELADEIGRDHIRALEDYFAALKTGAPIVCVLYDDANPKAREQLQIMGTRIVDDAEPTPALVYIPSLVWDTMRSHGLFNSLPPQPFPTKANLPEPTMVIDGTHMGSARGEELLMRKGLAWALSRFSAKTNKWLVLAAMILWPAVWSGVEALAVCLMRG